MAGRHETRREKVDQSANFEREVTRGRIKHVDPAPRRVFEGPQYGFQSAGANARPCDKCRHTHHAQSRLRRDHAGLGVREAQAPCDRNPKLFLPVRHDEAPDERIAKIGVDDAVVTCERGRICGLAPLGEIVRRSGDDDSVVAELSHDEARVGRFTDADGGVESFVDQVHHAVGEAHVENDLRIGAREIDQRRLQLHHAERQRNREREPSASFPRNSPH